MKSKILFVVSLLAVLTDVAAQRTYPDPFLSATDRPDALDWLPEPPALTSGAFANDFYYYQWGRDQRVDGIGEQALSDESAPLEEVFSEALGLTLSPEGTPEILLLVERAVSDVQAVNTGAKNHYQRVRPFATFKEPSLKPWTDEEEAATFSYPSGHSARGYVYAMALCAIAPDRTGTLMARARQYAINRVICGHHWKSDIDASLLLSAGVFATVVGNADFQQQLVKARQEYLRLTADVDAVAAPAVVEPSRAEVYDLQGRRLDTEAATSGVYISNGRKVVVK